MNLSASSAKPGDPTYFLEGIIHDKSEMADFEGPLSLILLLLSKNKIEIRDIKISDILDQYLEYLNAMEKLDLEIASEFVQMASYLLYIKTRMLLTEEKEVTELEQLIASLEQLKCKDTYAAVKTVTPMLEAAAQTGLHYLSRPPEPLPKAAGSTATASRRPIFCARCCPCSRAAARRRRKRCKWQRPSASSTVCAISAARSLTSCVSGGACRSTRSTVSARAAARSWRPFCPCSSCAVSAT